MSSTIDFRHAQEIVDYKVKLSLAIDNVKKMAAQLEKTRDEWRSLNVRLNAALTRADRAEKELDKCRKEIG